MPKTPKLRTVEKYAPPFPINHFPSGFAKGLGFEAIYVLATRPAPSIEGSDWEQIFARLIDARWKPSNIGLDDVVLEQTAWGLKTVKSTNPLGTKSIRLISGRNDPKYSFGRTDVENCNPDELGGEVLSIWNERVAGIRKLYRHVRTAVLIKSDDLMELSAFEFDTVIYPESEYTWTRNKNKNLVGSCKTTGNHKFTWQPHGSQFTIVESVPDERLKIRVKRPDVISRQGLFDSLGVTDDWVEIIHP